MYIENITNIIIIIIIISKFEHLNTLNNIYMHEKPELWMKLYNSIKLSIDLT